MVICQNGLTPSPPMRPAELAWRLSSPGYSEGGCISAAGMIALGRGYGLSFASGLVGLKSFQNGGPALHVLAVVAHGYIAPRITPQHNSEHPVQVQGLRRISRAGCFPTPLFQRSISTEGLVS